jgi:hypothetical protein
VENVPAVFAGNGFNQFRNRENGKKHAVRHAGKNVIDDNVKNGTGRTKPVSKTTIWPISLTRSISRNNRKILPQINRHDR